MDKASRRTQRRKDDHGKKYPPRCSASFQSCDLRVKPLWFYQYVTKEHEEKKRKKEKKYQAIAPRRSDG